MEYFHVVQVLKIFGGETMRFGQKTRLCGSFPASANNRRDRIESTFLTSCRNSFEGE
jgi:hypothetical protein